MSFIRSALSRDEATVSHVCVFARFLQAHDIRTNEVVAIKKMSYSGKQSNEVSFPTFHSHYIQSCNSLVVDSAFPSEGGQSDCIILLLSHALDLFTFTTVVWLLNSDLAQ